MATIYTGLMAGFIVGVICVVYVLVRTSLIREAVSSESTIKQTRASNNLLAMSIFSSASVVWGFIGAGVFHLIRDDIIFLAVAMATSISAAFFFYLQTDRYKLDKIVLSLIIFNGLGVLIPIMY